jgi:hypothetical protein
VSEVKVLIACEESGTVRDAFAALGHKVLSCDLEPSRTSGPHYRGDVFDVIDYPFDLAIFHPPCTHTSVSGAKHFAEKWNDGRQARGVSFIMALVRRSAHIPRVAIEQPVSVLASLWDCARDGFTKATPIQPWQFGHGETKATCLWLRGLPPLAPTQVVEGRKARIHHMAPSPERSRERSKTYNGIAQAMANQWSTP